MLWNLNYIKVGFDVSMCKQIWIYLLFTNLCGFFFLYILINPTCDLDHGSLPCLAWAAGRMFVLGPPSPTGDSLTLCFDSKPRLPVHLLPSWLIYPSPFRLLGSEEVKLCCTDWIYTIKFESFTDSVIYPHSVFCDPWYHSYCLPFQKMIF